MTVTTERPRVRVPGRSRVRRRVVRVLVGLLVVLALVPVAAASYVVVVARQDDRTPTDAILVLGAAQYWSRPSPVLEARLQHAKQLYDEGVGRRIVTVGGKQPGDRTTEAQAGRSWLLDRGVPATRVVAVPEGADTLGSLTAAAELMQARGWTSATLVTDPAHEARSLAMARALGIAARTSPTQDGPGSALSLDYVARETAGLLVFWLSDRRDVPQVVGSS